MAEEKAVHSGAALSASEIPFHGRQTPRVWRPQKTIGTPTPFEFLHGVEEDGTQCAKMTELLANGEYRCGMGDSLEVVHGTALETHALYRRQLSSHGMLLWRMTVSDKPF